MQKMTSSEMTKFDGGAWYDCVAGAAGIAVGIYGLNAWLILGAYAYLETYC